MPFGKGERRLAHGLLSNLGSRLVVPSPTGLAAVYVAGGRARFASAGLTPGVPRLLRGVLPLLTRVQGWRDQWFRANERRADLVDPAERGPLAPFIDESEAATLAPAAGKLILDVETAAMPDWTTGYPPQHRDMLRQHGMRSQDHPAAREYNVRLIERAEAGLIGQQLADVAGALFDELISEREEEEADDDNGAADWAAEIFGTRLRTGQKPNSGLATARRGPPTRQMSGGPFAQPSR
jgi:hypothetical protein